MNELMRLMRLREDAAFELMKNLPYEPYPYTEEQLERGRTVPALHRTPDRQCFPMLSNGSAPL